MNSDITKGDIVEYDNSIWRVIGINESVFNLQSMDSSETLWVEDDKINPCFINRTCYKK